MRRWHNWVAVLALSVALAPVLGFVDSSCPGDAVAYDRALVETDYGSFEIEVCIVHDAASGQSVYTFTLRNVDLGCPILAFGVRPFATGEVELESAPPWEAVNEGPHLWGWEGPPWTPIREGEAKAFVVRVDSTPVIGQIVGIVTPKPHLGCSEENPRFVLFADGSSAEITQAGEAAVHRGEIYNELCTCSGEPRESAVASSISVSPGYRAEYHVPPAVLNMPTDVVPQADGGFFVNTGRSAKLFFVDTLGNVSEYASVRSYSMDQDASGNLYSYHFPSGAIHLVKADSVEVIANVAPTSCNSTIASAPDGTLYVGTFDCEAGSASILELHASTRATREILSGLASVQAIDVTSDGTVFVTIEETLSILDPATGELREIATVDDYPSPNGLSVTDEEVAYISTGAIDARGVLYRVTPAGEVTVMASIADNGLQGIAVLPDGAVIGVQRNLGGLLTVDSEGQAESIIEPNGLVTPQSMTISACGDLVVVCDEAGWASIVCPNGEVNPFVQMTSYISPLTHVASSVDGWIVAGESASALFASELVLYDETGEHEVLADDLEGVSGVAVDLDGSIYAAVTHEDRIVRIDLSGNQTLIADGLRRPQALVLSTDGKLYATINQRTDDLEAHGYGDTVVEILPDGTLRVIAEVEECYALALDDDGSVYVTSPSAVWRINEAGEVSRFASGFMGASGIAYSDGVFYVSDEVTNAIVRIVRDD